ncbi:hypothetical protein [Demequina litorisediminis]|uniref:RNA polymerase sigma-70 region 2 domain-containing protein n=1 Tax=Demequina litorisediminis TaxID=1849022 RepID=A0ABQ6IA43_9MICO|nr:hypothetical protein [Demequina litorisediminis]GMA34733.1 hypothetical protein GCM10025876_09370 [Demequina litorisediminis]
MRRLTEADLLLARKIAQPFVNRMGVGEAESAAMSGLLEAAMKYREGEGTWEGYAIQRCRWRVLDALKRNTPVPTTSLPPEMAAPVVELPDAVDDALDAIPEPLQSRLRAGDVDMRRTEDREAIETIRGVVA